MTKNDSTLIKDQDFYLDEQGKKVLTQSFLAKRGYCCQSGCIHCPYGYKEKVDPNIPGELQDPWSSKEEALLDIYQKEIEEL